MPTTLPMAEQALTITGRRLADEIVQRANEAHYRLLATPFCSRLDAGTVDRDEYAAWLVQMHRFIRHTERGERALAALMAGRSGEFPGASKVAKSAARAVEEELGHDELIIDDLASLWGVSKAAALGRLERAPAAPSVLAWTDFVDAMIARFPTGIIGVALALETIATMVAEVYRDALVAGGRIEGIENAVSFLSAHTSEVEDGHTAAGRMRAEALTFPHDRSATFFFANAALGMYEGIFHFLDELFPAEKPELAAAGRSA